MNSSGPRPYGLLAELTHRCPLHCPYCSNPIQLVPRGDELPRELWSRAINQAAALGILQIGFSGGEPLLHPALIDLVGTAKTAGLYSNLITSGVGLTAEKADNLRDAGLDTIQISFQADETERGDEIAGFRMHELKLNTVEALRQIGMPWSANIVLHRHNIDRLESMIEMMSRLGAFRLELANTQFYGWAFRNREHLLPSLQQVRQAEVIVEKLRHTLKEKMQVIYVVPDYYERRPKPCLHGWGSRGITINPRGDVLPCQAAESIPDLKFDNIRHRDLAWIWNHSEAFNRFRGTEWMPSPCQSCELRDVDFGGCRCQAALLTGDPSATDPVCELSPHRGVIDRLLEFETTPGRPQWTYRAPAVVVE